MSSGLRGASADASAELRQRLDGVSDVARVGDELFGVAALLRDEPSLRRVATDASLRGDAKADLIRGILDGKVSGETLDLVADAVSKRWTATRDLADVLENLGVVAVVKSAGSEASRLDDELFSVAQIVNDNHDLRSALSDPARSQADKGALVKSLLEGKALPATVRLAEQSVVGSYRTPALALEAFGKIAADVHGESVATVTVAKELSEADQQRLGDALSRQYGRPIHLNVVIDPAVLGGIRVDIGDDVIDGAVSSRLDDAHRKLAG